MCPWLMLPCIFKFTLSYKYREMVTIIFLLFLLSLLGKIVLLISYLGYFIWHICSCHLWKGIRLFLRFQSGCLVVTLVRTFSSLLNGCGKSIHHIVGFLILGGMHLSDFYHAEEVSFQSKFIVCFYHKSVLDFDKSFFCISKDNHVGSFVSFS